MLSELGAIPCEATAKRICEPIQMGKPHEFSMRTAILLVVSKMTYNEDYCTSTCMRIFYVVLNLRMVSGSLELTGR